MVYTVTLNPALDYTVKVDSIKSGEINRSYDEQIFYGGKGINVSVILTRLGIENRALGFLAGFTGKELESMLKADGIDCAFNYLESGKTRINLKIKSAEEYEINGEGPKIGEEDIKALIKKLSAAKSGDWVVLAGAIPKSLDTNIYDKILSELEGKGINFAVDATGELLLKSLRHRPFLIKPNRHELEDLFKVEIKTDNEAEKYAKELQRFGAKNVIVSLSGDGALLVDETGVTTRLYNAPGEVINCVGCGDTMVAGFIAGYINTMDYAYALKLGIACGNATAYSEGLGEKDLIEKMLSES